MGFKTIIEGQRAIITNVQGRSTIVEGPTRVFLFRKQFRLLNRYIADQSHYLVIRYHDGNVKHTQGPTSEFGNPIEHESIQVMPVISLDANECLVVYKQNDTNKVLRRIVTGPQLFVPAPSEWLHDFVWHGSAPNDKAHKIPGATKFTKLRTVPDQFYFNVRDVRTADDALITVKLMLFFELTDIETMLNTTHDPVADFINSSTADVIAFASQLTYEQFLENTGKLNEIESYKQLVTRAQRIGYNMTKVVYRGYHASDNLQAMHDSAIQARTRLRLEAETEAQKQELADLKTHRELERNRNMQKIAREDADHKIAMERDVQKARLEAAAKQHEQDLQQKLKNQELELDIKARISTLDIESDRKKHELTLEMQQRTNQDKAAFFEKLLKMDVDLTKYLVSQYQHPDRIIRVDGVPSGNVHVHEN